jgi:hypothetical protein
MLGDRESIPYSNAKLILSYDTGVVDIAKYAVFHRLFPVKTKLG